MFAAQYREKLEITDFTFQAETGKQDLFFLKSLKNVLVMSPLRHIDVTVTYTVIVTSQ